MSFGKYIRLRTVPMGTVLETIRDSIPDGDPDNTRKIKAVFGDIKLKVSSLRLRCFAMKGTTCSACGLEGTFFAIESNSQKQFQQWHLNLYGVKDGQDVLFTHDHTLSRGNGGADKFENVTTMCSPCNHEKSKDER